jgi:thiamine-phosphate pyrophosphorylase
MPSRQTAWPRQWLMTDERMSDRLWEAIARLPDDDGGIVFRHYNTEKDKRAALARKVAAMCRPRGITLGVACDVDLACSVGADFVHRPGAATILPTSLPVHNLEQARQAARLGAALAFVSPVFPTRSHPGHAALGPANAEILARASRTVAIALGGMNAAKFASLPSGALHGWAGIDAWLSDSGD